MSKRLIGYQQYKILDCWIEGFWHRSVRNEIVLNHQESPFPTQKPE
jgi:hypothetical protein